MSKFVAEPAATWRDESPLKSSVTLKTPRSGLDPSSFHLSSDEKRGLDVVTKFHGDLMRSLRKKSDVEPLRVLISQSKELRTRLLSLPSYHSFYPKQAPCVSSYVKLLNAPESHFVDCMTAEGQMNPLVSSPSDPCLSNSPRLFSSELSETGIRRYLLTSYSRFLMHYHSLSQHSRHYYELIPQGKSVRVHMDVERRLEGLRRGGVKRGEGDIIKVLSCEFWRFLVSEFGDVVVPSGLTASQILSSPNTPEVISAFSSLTVHLTASTLKKFSCHLIFHVPGCVWTDNENLGFFVKAFVDQWDDVGVKERWGWDGDFWLDDEEKEKENGGGDTGINNNPKPGTQPGSGLTQPMNRTQLAKSSKSIIDTAIYTRNRVFRILGSTKYGKKGGEGRLKVWDRKGWDWGENFWAEFGEGGNIKNSSHPLNLSSPNPLTKKRLESALSFTSYAECFERTLVVPLSNDGCSKVLSWKAGKADAGEYKEEEEIARVDAASQGQFATYVPPPQAQPGFRGCVTVPPPALSFPNNPHDLPASLPFDAIAHKGKSNLRLPSCYPILDAYVSTYLCGLHARPEEGINRGVIGGWSVSKVEGEGEGAWVSRLTYDIRGNRWCGNIQRHHKANNIRFQLDLLGACSDLANGGCVWRQLCHDYDCRGYRSDWHEVEDEGVVEWEEGERWDRVCLEAVREREREEMEKREVESKKKKLKKEKEEKWEVEKGYGGDDSFEKALEEEICKNPRDWM